MIVLLALLVRTREGDRQYSIVWQRANTKAPKYSDFGALALAEGLGFEPRDRVNGHGLANRSINHSRIPPERIALVVWLGCGGGGGIRTHEACAWLFSRQLPSTTRPHLRVRQRKYTKELLCCQREDRDGSG
jgi:hypothetical protein